MSDHTADVLWVRDPAQDFLSNRYSRRHLISFDGGAQFAGSSSPHSVPVPLSDASAIDPEEAFVASLASCHMLWFLSLAAKKRFCVDRYADSAIGIMQTNAEGRVAITRVTLRPRIDFSGNQLPSRAEVLALHQAAHDACFIANSVKSEVLCEPVFPS